MKSDKRTYYTISCGKCGRDYDFMEYSPLPKDMTCLCGAKIYCPGFVCGYKDYGVIKGTINRFKTMIKYYTTKLFDKLFG